MNLKKNHAGLAVAFLCAVILLGLSSCQKIKKEDPKISLSLSSTELDLTIGQQAHVSATVEPAEFASELVWSTTDDKVATVSNGIITAVAKGKTTLWAFVRDAKASCVISVKAIEPSAITISETALDLKKGQTHQLTAALDPAGAEGEISWKSADENVAKVSASGLVEATGFGKTVISARCGLLSAECTVTIDPDPAKIGDYFYSDGTWSDGGLLSISEDGTNAVWASPKPAPEEGKTVIGIVFQTDQNRMASTDISRGFSHGYVVSTHIASYPDNAETRYSLDQGIDCLNNCKTGTAWYANLKGAWETDQVYNTYATEGKASMVPAFKLVKEDFDEAPESTSGWFLPSTGQLWDMVANFCGDEVAEMLKSYRTIGYDITYERGISASYSVIDKFNEMSALVPSSMKDDLYVPATESYHNYCGIWTSTLYDNSDGAACLIYLGNSKGKTFVCGDWVDNPYFVKPILAF